MLLGQQQFVAPLALHRQRGADSQVDPLRVGGEMEFSLLGPGFFRQRGGAEDHPILGIRRAQPALEFGRRGQ